MDALRADGIQSAAVRDSSGKIIVGWRERVDLPEWGIKSVLAKIDTGARTSAIHVENVEHVGDGEVSFEVVRSRKDPTKRTRVRATIKRTTTIKSSMGRTQERIVIETMVRIVDVEKRIEMSLVSRKKMLCRMLIGRTALASDFLVDASIKNTRQKI